MYGARGKLAVIWIYVNYLNYISICFQNHFPSLSTLWWYYLWHSESGICGKQGASGEKLTCSHSFLVSWWNRCKPFSSLLINCSLANEGFFLKGSYFFNQWSCQEIIINILTISYLFPLWILKVLTTTNIPEKIKIKNMVKRIQLKMILQLKRISQWFSSTPPGQNATCPQQVPQPDSSPGTQSPFAKHSKTLTICLNHLHMALDPRAELSFHPNIFHLTFNTCLLSLGGVWGT